MKSINSYIQEALIKKDTIIKSKLWTIEDAQDGDIITEYRNFDGTKSIYIFKRIAYYNKLKKDMIKAYCYYRFDNKAFHKLLNGADGWCAVESYNNKHFDYWLSTEDEKREFFNAMKNEGYTWDPIKKELKEI